MADPPPGIEGEAVAALLAASGALVGLATRSLAGTGPEITLSQLRTLVVLAVRGPQRAAEIAAELGVAPSAGTRMCDRLAAKGLLRRDRSTDDRRVVRLRLSAAGAALVDEVFRRRREALSRIVADTAGHWCPEAVAALTAFAVAAGETPERQWCHGRPAARERAPRQRAGHGSTGAQASTA
ncbi:MarR family winged helix-turn-helix transcriptional regulator [Micromonospora carbonacea]|uniref:Winged helix-turn-helix transcriptional regulator n=1 Tax=Micromonospora carbonacea TaxID=47853 RepID=A0A7H8XM09_9ACTN|nr:MarR family winged helix-turn-helix transcriptional regulator [Micromonospora carbonacea]MBB5826582.1 DNA-binding MarR family transcriptional regulator [Micromonospora carbonacea]QLD26083.1 winged helix-turn-helix transcriptional regulator [Micromonospora carbonacea]